MSKVFNPLLPAGLDEIGSGGGGVTDHSELTGIGTNTHAQIDAHIASAANPHSVTKAQVGLGNVDNTSDANKPISIATQSALDLKSDTSHNHNLNDLAEKSYNSLTDKPTIPDTSQFETSSQLDERDTANRDRANHTGTQAISTVSGLQNALDEKADSDHTHTVSDITDFPTIPDTDDFVRKDGSNLDPQQEVLQKILEQQASPDMGYLQNSNRAGYYPEKISNKDLKNVTIKGSYREERGSVRTTKSNEYQIYLGDEWKTIVTGFRFRENASGGYALEHKPVGFETWIAVHTGNSVNVGLNGKPMVQAYQVSMGAYPEN